MKYIKEYLKDVIRIKPLGELTTKDDEFNGMSGEMVYIDSKCTDIFISHADYANWLEKQGQTFTKKDVDDAYLKSVCDAKQELEKQGKQKLIFNADDWYVSKVDGKIHNIYNVGVEPKFKVGDWVVDKSGLAQQILDFRGGVYTCTYNNFITDCESNYHLWTIQDAKDGDVLAFKDDSYILLVKEIHNTIYGMRVSCYCHVLIGKFEIGKDNWSFCGTLHIHPATKEQRDILFAKMREADYQWDDEKRELTKIEKRTTMKAYADTEQSKKLAEAVYTCDICPHKGNLMCCHNCPNF